MNVGRGYRYVQQELKRRADRKRAEGEKRYLKSPWRFHGVRVPERRKLARMVLREFPQMTKADLMELVARLWESEWHEEKSVAVMLLELNEGMLTLNDLKTVEWMVDTVTGWDHLDELAIKVLGPMVESSGQVWSEVQGWMRAVNCWKRRAVILCQIPQFRQGGGDWKVFEKVMVSQFNEGGDWSKEERFFIRKAIGWALREAVRNNPERVFELVKQYQGQMSGLTFREATRKLPNEYKERLDSFPSLEKEGVGGY